MTKIVRAPHVTLIVCLAVFVISASVTMLQVWEASAKRVAYRRFRPHEVAMPITLGSYVVRRSDTSILIGDRAVAWRSSHFTNTAFVRLEDQLTRESVLAIVGYHGGIRERDWQYDILFVKQDGTVQRDSFTFAERRHRPHRTLLARYVSPRDIGFTSGVLTYWPTFTYPILFPWLSGLTSLSILIAIGARTRFARTDMNS